MAETETRAHVKYPMTIKHQPAKMAPPEQRIGDRTPFYAMKTPGRPQPGSSQSHSRSNSQSLLSNRTNSPVSSLKQQGHGQILPSKVSPGGAERASAQEGRPSSPNYFGLSVEPAADTRESSAMPRENWSPTTSSVKSFAAALPQQVPLDANPEFEAFKRQIDMNRGTTGFLLSGTHFSLSAGGNPMVSTPSVGGRPGPPKWNTHISDAPDAHPGGTFGMRDSSSSSKADLDGDSLHDSAYISADSKRNSQVSLNPPSFLNAARHESPLQYESAFTAPRRSTVAYTDDMHAHLSMTHAKVSPPSPDPFRQFRADTVPAKLEPGSASMMAPIQLKELLENSRSGDLLVLDLRVSPQYAQSRIKGALNLCIPTTLLKRATFNLQKLQQTFQAEQDQEKFATWNNATYLVVYDAASSDKRDAVSAVNMLKKFTNEGYDGLACILRGGFKAFEAAYPHLVDRSSSRSSPSLSLGGGTGVNGARPSVAPVIGGVMLPTTNNEPIPFFSNIRQNQDLVDGVGQMDIGVPAGLDTDGLPRWLREATARGDHGKKIADKFLQIERTEQARMKMAYSAFGPANTLKPERGEQIVQLSGIEKGVKNRYKDILPFEHARVRLQGRPEGECDYVNASHIQATRSHKKYIASQGPLPATFEDFWSVIWDQDVRVVVMLTAESEGGQLKCHPYWQGKEFGPIKLRALSEKKVSLDIDKHRTPASQASETSVDGSLWNMPQAEQGRRRANTTTLDRNGIASVQAGPGGGGGGNNNNNNNNNSNNNNSSSSSPETPYVIIRKFALSHTAHPFEPIREITHLHYSHWPDFGAPAQPSHLLALVELVNVMQNHSGTAVDASRAGGGNSSRRGSIATATSSGSVDGNRRRNGDEYAGLLSWQEAPEADTRSKPVLVHCSAGCGRTGTFCTVDSVIDMLKRQRQRVQRSADRRIAARERRIATLVDRANHANVSSGGGSEGKRGRGVDSDGDVMMGGNGNEDGDDFDVISPLRSFSRKDSQKGSVTASSKGLASHGADGMSKDYLHDSDLKDLVNDNEGDDDDLTELGIDTSWLGDDSVDLIARTVEDFRTQRLSMVQSLRQFVLCYETVLEWVSRLQDTGAGSGVDGRAHSRVKSMIT